MIVDRINDLLNAPGGSLAPHILQEVGALASLSFLRQFGTREETKKGLRLSSIGKCTRMQAYKLLEFEENGKELDARAKMVFFQGDLAELSIVALAVAAGCDLFAYGQNQSTVSLFGIDGHPDGIIRGDKENTLLEVKSMSSYAFSAFQNQDIDPSYRYQINAYMQALDLNQCCIVGLNKDSGVLHEWIIKKDSTLIEDIANRVEMLSICTKENLPPKNYTPDEKGFLPWNCLYCGFWKTCRPDAQRVLVNKRYRLREVPPLESPDQGAITNDGSHGKPTKKGVIA